MDSTLNSDGSSPSDPDPPNDDSEITFLVNANIYKQWRSQYVDEIELSVWNIDMVKFAISTNFDNYGSIKTAIQRGVPDIIKHYIWIKANDADKFYIENPNFYKSSFSTTFGDNVPSEMGEYCPTFCGGILGFQADVLDSPLVMDQLHHQFDGSLESEIMYDSDDEYNYWINPYKESSPSFRDLSAPSITNKTSKGLGSIYSKFVKKFKQKDNLNKQENNNQESFFSVRDDFRDNTISGTSFNVSGYEKSNTGSKGLENEASSSTYSIQIADYPRASSEYGNKDRLIDYIHLLNHENANKRKLMKSALDKIRKGSLDTKPFMRNVEKSRQMSDTFIYNSMYTSFPPPPSHHSKLMQRHDVDDSLAVDNPFFKGQKSIKKKQSNMFSCFVFICRSRNTNRSNSNSNSNSNNSYNDNNNNRYDNTDSKYNNNNNNDSMSNLMNNSYVSTPNQADIQNAYNQMYGKQNEELCKIIETKEQDNSNKDKEYNKDKEDNNNNMEYRNTDDSIEDQLDSFKRYKSDSHIDKFVNRSTLINDLPGINTIPEHSASNSLSHNGSKMLSNASNMLEESYSLLDVKDEIGSTEHLPSLKESIDIDNMTIMETTYSREYTPASFKPESEGFLDVLDKNKDNDTDVVDISRHSDLNQDDVELVSKLSKVISRQLSNKSLDGSVYKLSDVTDFTVLLTEEGVIEVKRILWCLNSYFSTTVEFLPIIPSLCCLLLMYLSPNAVLCVLYRFLNMSLSTCNLQCGSRFFFVNRKGFVTFVTFVLSVMVSHMKKTIEHLRSLKVDLAAWVARSVQTGFSQILPFDYIVRIYGNFIFEGEIVLCRYCVALVKCIRTKLMECSTKDEAEELLYHVGLDPSLQIDKLTKIAFSLRIKKFDKKITTVETPTPYLMNVKIRQFYRPRLSSKSSIVNEIYWEVIWANLKSIYRILDPHNLYSSNLHGNTMLGLTKRLVEHGKISSPALLFVKTSKLHIFGVFIPNLLNCSTKGYFTPQEILYQMNSFVFTLFPYQKMYEFTSKNPTGIKLSKDKLIVGANGPSIILDKTLTSGHTSFSESYNSPPLVPGSYFNVYMVEIWILS